MQVNWKKFDSYGGVALGCLMIGYLCYVGFSQTWELNTKAKYTVGEIVKFYKSGHLVEKIKYQYYVNGEEYRRSENYQGGEIGQRYFIKYSSETPKYSDFLQDKPVPDSIKVAPLDGWQELPN